MKQLKRFVITFAAALFCFVPFLSSSMTVHADGPVTYYLKYVESLGEWRHQTGTWDDNAYHSDLYSLTQNIKDGDLLVIDGNSSIKLSVDVNLNNLTIVNSTGAVVAAKSIENFYAINNSVSAISGDITNAEVYDACTVNFNNSIKNLKLLSYTNDLLQQTVYVVGTVDTLTASGKSYTHYTLYNFAANTLRVEAGELKTDAANFSSTASTTTAATTTTTATTTTNSASDEYDDVPKTGDVRVNPLWFVGIATICLAGSYALKKRA